MFYEQTRLVFLWNSRTFLRITEADGKNSNLAFGSDRGRLERIRLLVVAIRNEQDRLVPC